MGPAQADSHVAQAHYPYASQKTFEGPEDYFTGKVDVRMLFPTNATADFSGAYVTFQAGARSAWHLHPAGQHIVVTDGHRADRHPGRQGDCRARG
ncbi:hypothetical protein [Motiliproteus sp. SC1-56]|uniref:hypothetical protein n=1 Tax=Motiliproteus sp. SC1-56 TaxID=2799565 RepID=UPI001A8F0EAD|nr:hypothetical protein [Motiliproteus sp. SC1-56]